MTVPFRVMLLLGENSIYQWELGSDWVYAVSWRKDRKNNQLTNYFIALFYTPASRELPPAGQ